MNFRSGLQSRKQSGLTVSQPLLYAQTTVQSGDSVTGASEQTFATTVTLAANSLQVGQVLCVDARGIYNQFSTPGSQTFKVKFGTTVVCATATFAGTANMSNRSWWLTCNITVISIGASGSVESQGFLTMGTAAKNAINCEMPNTAVVGSIDMTAAISLNLSVTQTNSNASNNAQLRQLVVSVLNP